MNKVFQNTIEISKLQKNKSLQEIENYNEKHIISKIVDFKTTEKSIKTSIIFSTSKGVFILDTRNNICKQILKGKFYGITKHNDFFFFARLGTNGKRDFPINDRVSEICYAKIVDYNITNLKIALYGIPAEIHQIENLAGSLIFPHTGYNQVLSINFERIYNSNKPLQINSCKSIELELNQHSHLNSVFYKNEKIYLIAHNYTMKTNKLSDLIIYDTKTKMQKLINLNAHSAHNIYINEKNERVYCDSNNKKLIKNKKVIFETDKLLRGLSITEKNIFVGGSDICFNDYKRFSSNSSIYVLDKDGNLQTEFIFDEIGDIYEIRQLDEKELSIIQN